MVDDGIQMEREPMVSEEENKNELHNTNESQRREQHHINPEGGKQPRKYLGVWHVPINNGKEKTKVLKEKVKKWAKVYSKTKWAKTRAMEAVNMRIMKGIESHWWQPH